jgi:hypothetical protein
MAGLSLVTVLDGMHSEMLSGLQDADKELLCDELEIPLY